MFNIFKLNESVAEVLKEYGHKKTVKEAEGDTPVRGGIYSLDVVPKKGQKVWSTKWGEKFQFPFDPIDGGNRSKVAFSDPPSHRYVKMGSIATETLRIAPTGSEAVKEAEGNNPGSEEFGAGAEQPKKPGTWTDSKPGIRKAIKDYREKLAKMPANSPDRKFIENGIKHYEGVLAGTIKEHDLSSEAPEAKNQPEGHDEEKEIKDDPTREKLETAKDEADERKGGPAELAADLRVSIRIERMNVNRYKKMLVKHELSSDDEKWLNGRIDQIETEIKNMEEKVPELENESGKAVRETIVAQVRSAILELAKG